jgi:hypothetical protein
MGIISGYRSGAFESQQEIDDQFDAFIELYFNYIMDKPTGLKHQFQLTLIARSPESPVAQAICRYASEFRQVNALLRTIFGYLTPAEAISNWLDPSSDLYSICPQTSIRWSKNPSLLDAHEQLILGQSMCWSGGSMRQSADRRDVMDLFEDDCPGTAKLGQLAFEAMWAASQAIPASHVKRYTNNLVRPQDGLRNNDGSVVNNSFAPGIGHWLPTRH